jgi:hypothetical protein
LPVESAGAWPNFRSLTFGYLSPNFNLMPPKCLIFQEAA